MVLGTTPSEFWAEPRLVLSPSDTLKAARIGGMTFDEFHLVEYWLRTRDDPALRADLHDAAAFGLHLLLARVAFEDLFAFSSPFITDDSF
ncbi:MAG: hypothetical protein V2I43_01270 [Parvularcula sp.]|jgi:hypothetical protein|nr:hypothetical protein [Parvularcula sp.]